MAPITKGPFYAIRIVVGEIGTFAGLATNAECQVIDQNKKSIEGLFAVGNDAASIMGGNYPGAGITLGPAVTLGYVAAMSIVHSQASLSQVLLQPNLKQLEKVRVNF
jgi:predicted oxidoreductase